MGATPAKTDLDQAYRDLVSDFLTQVMKRNQLNLTELGRALRRDRATASRYVSGKVRTPLHQLTLLQRPYRETVPREIEDAYWASEGQPEPVTRKVG